MPIFISPALQRGVLAFTKVLFVPARRADRPIGTAGGDHQDKTALCLRRAKARG